MPRAASLRWLFLSLVLIVIAGMPGPTRADDLRARLAEWRKGVWISGGGTYTVYTDTHYFVLSFEGDTSSANLYFGVSQLAYHDKGTARKQVVRIRQLPGGEIQSFKKSIFEENRNETPLEIDTSLFIPGTCTIKDGVIYDAVTEVTDEYILLSTCNGDQEKIFANGVSVYLPEGGGEFYSYRVERF